MRRKGPSAPPSSPAAPEPASDDLADAYARLRRIAQRLVSGERAGHTLSATDVVHEAIAKLIAGGSEPLVADHGTDFATFVRHAAKAMTEVLIDHARRRNAQKRGGGRARVRLEDLNDVEATIDADASGEDRDFDWAALDAALDELQRVDQRKHAVVVMRFFAGLDNRQIARQLGVDERTVGRDWSAARVWLKKSIKAGDRDEER
jgi:RNA polymerase sigma factor (TIGR02999 family)